MRVLDLHHLFFSELHSREAYVLISANTLYGPMHTKSGVQEYVDAVKEIEKQGGKIAFGGKVVGYILFVSCLRPGRTGIRGLMRGLATLPLLTRCI